jgi:hypothetical protein
MLKFLLWCLLFVLCWPLALAALVLYPFVWLVLLPFRLVGVAVGGRWRSSPPSFSCPRASFAQSHRPLAGERRAIS